jgi:hypothetical protein
LESPERFFWIRVCLEKKTHLLGRTKGRFIRLSAHKKSKSLFSCEDSDAPVLNVDSDAPVLIVDSDAPVLIVDSDAPVLNVDSDA